MKRLLDKIVSKHPELKNQTFAPSQRGTKHHVFLSEYFVVRIRREDPDILIRESEFLKQIKHELVPEVLWFGKIGSFSYAIENRSAGETLQDLWKDIKANDRQTILNNFVDFLFFMRSKTFSNVYSIKTGRSDKNYFDLLTDNLEEKITAISKQKIVNGLLEEIVRKIKKPSASRLFKLKNNCLVHGDLIFHNLLTDGKHLTGVLDWELASTGDPDYDIFRLMNFKESARIYLDEGVDEYFEHDYLDSLLTTISKSKIANFKEEKFKDKYKICKAAYYLNALFWAVNSDSPDKNIRKVFGEYKKFRHK